MHGLWNNAWFYLNGPHVLQGGPQTEEPQGEQASKGMTLNQFREMGLDSMAFPEYSDDFPHVQVRRNMLVVAGFAVEVVSDISFAQYTFSSQPTRSLL